MVAVESILHEAKKLFATGHPVESIEYFTKAGEEGCNPVTVYLNRGAAFLTTGDFRKAITDFDRVLAIDEDNERAFYYRGIAYLNLKFFNDVHTGKPR